MVGAGIGLLAVRFQSIAAGHARRRSTLSRMERLYDGLEVRRTYLSGRWLYDGLLVRRIFLIPPFARVWHGEVVRRTRSPSYVSFGVDGCTTDF